MIEVKLIIDKDNKYYKSLLMTGHSDMSKAGTDIVCAAASTLAFTLVNYLSEVVGLSVNDLNFHEIESEDSPVFSINIEEIDLYSKTSVQSGFQFFNIGMLSLSEEYKDYVKLIYREV